MDKDELRKNDLSKKYNLQALNQYNFENVDFDINFGDVTEKDMERMRKEQAEELERLKKEKESQKK